MVNLNTSIFSFGLVLQSITVGDHDGPGVGF